jgi:hypothetical protein
MEYQVLIYETNILAGNDNVARENDRKKLVEFLNIAAKSGWTIVGQSAIQGVQPFLVFTVQKDS